ncbi:MAG TPA: glycosyltransferase family 2 protein [Flavisolibacter sp.]|nr:glycosyltransferase family 2 protein [Flavisolibacter sp.]
MLLSIIIINYNTFQLTCECIRSIKETTHVEHEIILVDNNSKECSPQRFLEVFPDIKLIALQENVGFGRANNRGVEEASGKYVLLLNSDTLVHQRTLDETVGYLETNPQVDILGCKVLFDNNSVQTTVVKDEREYQFLSALKYLVKRNTLFVEARLFLINKKQSGRTTEEQPAVVSVNQTTASSEQITLNYHNGKRIGSLVGVFLLLKKSVYVSSKGFDPDFFMYYEEIEWFVNRLRNFNVVYYPNAAVLHYHGASDVHKKMNLQFFVSQYLFWYKMGYLQYISYFFFILLEIPSRAMARVLFGRKRPSEDIPQLLKAIPYFFKVLRYPNRYGARPESLKLNYLQKHNY